MNPKKPTPAESRPPYPPFDLQTAQAKVRKAEDAWNERDPEKVALAYTADSRWRNRSDFLAGREQIVTFLRKKWQQEREYRLIKQLWAFTENRISVRFQYEFQNNQNEWFRAYGNEHWEFNDQGLMYRREASINDVRIAEAERRFQWPLGPRPNEHPGLEATGHT